MKNPGSVSAGARREKQGAEYGYRAERAAPIFAAAGGGGKENGTGGKIAAQRSETHIAAAGLDGFIKQKSGEKTLRF